MIFFLAAVGITLMQPPAGLDEIKMLAVIRSLESGDRWNSPGGAYQFKLKTWTALTRRPYAQARNPVVANEVALMQLHQIQAEMRLYRIAESPGAIYLAWRWGTRGLARGDARGSDLGIRANNLYHSL